MKSKDILPHLEKWAAQYNKLDKISEELRKIFGTDCDSPIFDSVWGTFDLYTDCLSETLGDDCSWLAWFCWDNGMGSKGLKTGTHKKKGVKTLKDLAALIEK